MKAQALVPTETEFYVTGEDMNFKQVGNVKALTLPKDYAIQINELCAKVGKECRFIDTLPIWHEGVGGKSHTFFDEITVN